MGECNSRVLARLVVGVSVWMMLVLSILCGSRYGRMSIQLIWMTGFSYRCYISRQGLDFALFQLVLIIAKAKRLVYALLSH